MGHFLHTIEAEIAALKAHGPKAFLDWAHLDAAVAAAKEEVFGPTEPEAEPDVPAEAQTDTVADAQPETPADQAGHTTAPAADSGSETPAAN